MKKLAAWVRIPGLPIEFCNDKFLWRVGATIGTMLRVDHHTSIHSRGKFARICVELDLRRELVPSFTVLGEEFKLEYEGLHLICFGCGKYGHRQEQCPNVIRPEEVPGPETTGDSVAPMAAAATESTSNNTARVDFLGNNPQQDSTANLEGDHQDSRFGPWMLAKKLTKKRGVGPKNQSQIYGNKYSKDHVPNVSMQQYGSRFDAFNSVEAHITTESGNTSTTPSKIHTSKHQVHHSGSKPPSGPTQSSSKKVSRPQAPAKNIPKDKGKGARKDPTPIATQPKVGGPTDQEKNNERQPLDPVAREQRAQRELQMLRDMQRIQRQHFSNPTGSIVDLLYGSSQPRGGVGKVNNSGDIMEDVVMENPKPPDQPAGELANDSIPTRESDGTTCTAGPGVSSSS